MKYAAEVLRAAVPTLEKTGVVIASNRLPRRNQFLNERR